MTSQSTVELKECPVIGQEYFDATENLVVVVEQVVGDRVYYSGDAEGFSTIERFNKDFEPIGAKL
jgi:hypothetical protein